MSANKFIAIENVLDPFDINRLWYYIPSFNGYEVSNDGYIRSMKHYRKYPCGIMIKPVSREPYGSSTDPLFEISDNNNKRQRIRLSQLIHLARTNQFSVMGYPRTTIVTNTGSRNKYIQKEDGAIVKVYNGNKKFNTPLIDPTAHYPKFTVVQDGTEMPYMTYCQPEVTVPIWPLKGDQYYGRQDCKCILAPQLEDKRNTLD